MNTKKNKEWWGENRSLDDRFRTFLDAVLGGYTAQDYLPRGVAPIIRLREKLQDEQKGDCI